MEQPSKKETTGTVEPAASETNTTTASAPLPEVLTARQVAELIGVSRKTIYRLVAKGDLPGRKEGGALRFDRDVVLGVMNVAIHGRAAALGVPQFVPCPFCTAMTLPMQDDDQVVYECRSAKCTRHKYQRAFGGRFEGEPAEFERAFNVGGMLCVAVVRNRRKTKVSTRSYDGVEVVEYEGGLSLFEAIAGCGGSA